MSYREDERKKAIAIRDKIFRDPGDGTFFKKSREFVLKDPALNLWAGIRADAIKYFERNKISWWSGNGDNEPTGHLLSSQVACLNHLYFIRQREDAATAILKNISTEIEKPFNVDDGFVEFEAIGKINYLGEKAHTRGANCTSVDAIMVGKKRDGKNILVLIEWKYTEDYQPENKYIPERYKVYDKLLADPACPISINDFEALYYEPFYQLMRQTLLGWKMVQAGEYGCDDYLHVHVIPDRNQELKNRITSPKLTGSSMSDAWKKVLKEPDKYLVLTPQQFIRPIESCPDTNSILSYLEERYWRS